MLVILFGLTGAGKNYVGNILAKHFNYYFWDADELLSDEMKQCIQQRQNFTKEMREQFVKIIIAKINLLQQTHQNIVIAQALYREDNRQTLWEAFPDALFIHVKASQEIIFPRLKIRANSVDEAYAQQIAVHFQLPLLKHESLVNEADEEMILHQLNEIFNKYSQN